MTSNSNATNRTERINMKINSKDCLCATSTHFAHWYVVPADDKENARLIVSQIVLDVFHELKMEYPSISGKRKRELKAIRKQL